MKRKMYRIELKSIGGLANELATLASLSNGGKYISLKDMESIAKVECIKLPITNEGVSVNPIGENVLTIDRGTENILVLTEVEVMELDMPQITKQEAKDLLDELAPTLNRQSGIANSDHHENLN